MKSGMFESYLEAFGFLIAGALVSGIIIYGILEIIRRLS